MTATAVLAARTTRQMIIAGVAMTYGVPATIDGTTEYVEPGAFRNLDDPNILLVDGHRDDRLLARTGAGTLQIIDSPRRLEYRATLPETELGRDVWTQTRRGDYGGGSVGMVVDDERLETSNGRVVRTVVAARLIHISPVGAPAYPETPVRVAADRTNRMEYRKWQP